MKRVGIVGFLLLLYLLSFSQLIPPNRLADWNAAGLSQNPPSVDSIVNVVSDLGLSDDGSGDVSVLFETALGNATTQTLFYFPPGAYLFQSTVNVPSNVIIKGAGADSTTFIFDLGGNSGHCFQLAGSQTSTFADVQSGLTKGAVKIVSTAASAFSSGDYLELKQSNGSWDSNPAAWATDVVGQITAVDAVIGDTIYLDQKLRIDYDTALNPQIRRLELVEFSGFECFSIERSDQAPGTSHNFLFSKAANCWMKGIESRKSNGSHVMITSSTNIEVRDSYFRRAFEYNGASTHGYGVTIAHHAGLCLVENNIFKFLRHAMMVKEGANGNVFAYNYSREPNRSELISDFSGDISVHGHYPYANLFEGNIVQNIIIDHYWGPGGPNNTFLRNATELYGLLMTSGSPNTEAQHFVSNDVHGFGFYSVTGNDNIEAANRWQDSIQPYSDTILRSYYLNEKPVFWNIPIAWPSIGEGRNFDKYTNPAKERYFSNERRAYCCQPLECSDTCQVPVNLKARFKGGKKVALEWKEGSSNSYLLRGRKVGENDWLIVPVNCSNCDNKVFSGLEFNAEYEWQVRSVCGSEHSLWSALHTFSLADLSFCDTTEIHQEVVGTNNAVLSWSGVKGANFYLLLGRIAGTSTITEIILDRSDTMFNATGLNSGTTYEYTVRAVCDSIGFAISQLNDPRLFTTLTPPLKGRDPYANNSRLEGKKLILHTNGIAKMNVQLFSVDGKLVYEGQHEGYESIDLNMLSGGFYILRTNSETRPIIIK
ncbi:MAG: hypothetical protein HKN92_12745 [Chitinophagales bacterium]|nr:hypothetical protein [Chitinophagales bacterium]